MKSCKHKWKPYQQWLGRYSCEKCKVIGYTDGRDYGFLGVRSTHGGKITPYQCSRKHNGNMCTKLATTIIGDLALCNNHKKDIKITATEREYHEIVEKQNIKDKKMLEDSFAQMKKVKEEALGK